MSQAEQAAPAVPGPPILAGEGSPCPEVTLKGKTYKIGWNTRRAKDTLQLLVAWAASQSIDDLRGSLPPVKLAAMEESLEEQLKARRHHTFGSLWTDVLDGPSGSSLVLASLLKEHQSSLSLADLHALAVDLLTEFSLELRVALAQVIGPFAQTLLEKAPLRQEQKAERARLVVTQWRLLMGLTDETPT